MLALIFTLLTSASSWRLLWSDEFSGNVLNESLWNVNNNVSEGSNQVELYTRDNAFLDGRGHLVLRTRPQAVTHNGVRYNITSGRVDTMHKGNVSLVAPGRVEVSARLQNDAAAGIHTAHWLLGYGCWPVTAEVDIMECQSPHNAYK